MTSRESQKLMALAEQLAETRQEIIHVAECHANSDKSLTKLYVVANAARELARVFARDVYSDQGVDLRQALDVLEKALTSLDTFGQRGTR